MRINSWQHLIRRANPTFSALVVVVALGWGVARGEVHPALQFDAEELSAFTVDDAELFPRVGDDVPREEPDPARLIPPRPDDMTDPALNLVPLPAPLAPALLGASALAAQMALRRRRTVAARVFRSR